MTDLFNSPFSTLGNTLAKRQGNAHEPEDASKCLALSKVLPKQGSATPGKQLGQGPSTSVRSQAQSSGPTKSHGHAKHKKKELDEEAELFALAMSGVVELDSCNPASINGENPECLGGLQKLADKFPNKFQAGKKHKTAPPTVSSSGQLEQQVTGQPATQETINPADTEEPPLTWHEYLNASDDNPELERRAFTKAMQGVAPVNKKGRDLQPAPEASATKVPFDQNLALQELLEGKLEFSLEFSGEFVQCQVVGLDSAMLEKLKAGQYSPEAHVDLHGQNSEQAYASLLRFIRHSYQRNLRNVIVVTGRGLNSPNRFSVLRESIQTWLTREPFKRVVLAFCTARPHDGGPGALYVLLRKYKKSRGKVCWDKALSPDECGD